MREGVGGAATAAPRAPVIHRLGALKPSWRALMIAVLIVAAWTPLLQAVRAVNAGWYPAGDVALIGLRARDVPFSPPLLGQPDSADNLAGSRESAHLGPIESYLLFVPVAVLGPQWGMAIGTALLNSAMWALALFLAHRRGGPVLLALFALGMTVYIRGIGASVLHDPINSDIATVALVPMVLAAWSLVEGDIVAAPLLAGLSTLVLQAHLANAGIAAVCVVAGGAGLAAALRQRRPGAPRWAGAAGAVLLVLWLPPILSELGNAPSNVAAVWNTLWSPRTQIGLAFGIGRAAVAVAPWPVPYLLRAPRSLAPSGFVSPAHLAVGLAILGFSGSVAAYGRISGHRTLARFLWLSLGVGVAAGYTASLLPWGSIVRPEHARWVWLLGLLVWVGLAWAGWCFVSAGRRRRIGRYVVFALLALAAIGSADLVRADPLRINAGRWAMPRIQPFSRELRQKLPKGTYVIEPMGPVSVLTFAPGVVLDLDAHGYGTYVPPGPLARGYDGYHFYAGQAVDGRVMIVAAGEGDPPPGSRRIVRQKPIAPVSADGDAVMEAYLLPEGSP